MTDLKLAEMATLIIYTGASICARINGIEPKVAMWAEFDDMLRKVADGEETLLPSVAEARMKHPDNPYVTEEGRRQAEDETRRIASLVLWYQEGGKQ